MNEQQNVDIVGQFRFGASGLIYIEHVKTRLQNTEITVSKNEAGIYYVLILATVQDGSVFKQTCQYEHHTIQSILEKYPVVVTADLLKSTSALHASIESVLSK